MTLRNPIFTPHPGPAPRAAAESLPVVDAGERGGGPGKWPTFPIVGIGASAGGLESLERFFTHMPKSSGMAFVVVQHLSPDFKSLIDELLARRTRIPILQAEDQVKVEPDTVYVSPPRKEIVIKGGRLLLSDKDPKQGLSLPIDHFFRSLAQHAGPMGAAVVLSGTGTDGSRGLLEVKRMGGLVIAESETSAKFDGMPLAAQNTGVVDHVLWPEEMPDVLFSYSRESLQTSVEELEASNEELQAANEELVAANEELQSTNEELHSVNEELYTVNAKYQRKILELEELNADFRHLLDGTDVGMLFLDSELRVRKFTPKIANIFRVMPRDVGRKLSDFSHRLDRRDLIADVQNALDTGAVVETDVQDDTGKCFYMRVLPYSPNAPAEPGSGPRPAPSHHGVVLTFTDISALEQARSRVGQLSTIVESSEDAIVSTSLDGTISSWNAGAERLYGYAAEQAIGRSEFQFVPKERREEETLLLKRLARGERVDHVETERLHVDGRRIPVSVTMSPIRDARGDVVGVSAIGRDITQLVAARREIREREEHNRLLLESMAEGVYGVDLAGACTLANPACAKILGYDGAEQLVGKAMHAHHMGPDGTPEAQEVCVLETGARKGQEVHADDRLFVTRDGKHLPVEYWSHPVAVGGRVVGAVVTFIDIAERKLAQQQLVGAARRREEFLAMLSHELRNPLAAVLNASTLMSKPTAKPQMVERARNVVARQAAHMARLLDDLLDVARIMRGAVGLRNRQCDFRECARAAVEALHPLLSAHRTELRFDVPDQPLFVHGDPDRLQQIVANLLGNAASYSPDYATVRLALRSEGGEVILRIEDQGIGIDPDLLPHIFELFVQAEQKLDRPKGGLGIGLTLVKTLVELHGGTVEAHSAGPGTGSAFVVRLPESSRPTVVAPEARPSPGRPRNIVLVEDHEDSRELLKALLETKGYSVAEAADGHAALEAIRSSPPDVALVDIGLPGMDGYELARIIRQDPALKDLVLVALTGYGRDADIRRAKETGFNHHLTKPVGPDVLDGLLSTL